MKEGMMASANRLTASLAAVVLIVSVLFCSGVAFAATEAYEVQFEKGILALEEEDTEQAALLLSALEKDAPADPELLYYIGQAYWKAGDTDKASSYLEKVYSISPGSEFGRAARRQLDLLEAAEPRPYRVQAYAGFQYDTNVPLVPNVTFLSPRPRIISDWSWIGLLRASYVRPLPGIEGLSLGASYDVYQSLHFRLDAYDVQDHKLKASASYTRNPVTASVVYGFDYTFLGGDDYERSHTITPRLRAVPGWGLAAEAYYEFKDANFFTDGRRDSRSSTVGVDLYKYFMSGRSYLRLGYFHETVDAHGQDWDSDGQGVAGRLLLALPADARLIADAEYRSVVYGRGFPFNRWRRSNRHNSETAFSFSLGKKLSRSLDIIAAYTNLEYDSTFREFDCDRELVTFMLAAKY